MPLICWQQRIEPKGARAAVGAVRKNPGVPDDYGFSDTPLADTALSGQNLDLLTAAEKNWIHAYSVSAYENINQAMRGQIPMTSALEHRIATIRSGLAKYPIPFAVRVSREIDSAAYGIADNASPLDLLYSEIEEPAFLSTCGLESPRRNLRRTDPLIMDLLVPAGTPALRLGELAEIPDEREVLIIDARIILVVGVHYDPTRKMWRIEAVVVKEEAGR